MKKSCRQYAVILFLTLSCVVFSCTQNDPKPASIQEAVDNIVSPYIVLGADVGILVGTIQNGEKTIYSFGEREIGSKEKMTGQSVLEIASLTKTYTALALADMHLKGDLNLDDPIENYLPNTVRIPSYNGKKITLRHLANHTSGFPRFASNADKDVYNEYKGYTEQKMYDFISNYTLQREPGTEFEYSAVGYGLLGQILSLKNNSNYEAMMMSNVLLPLNMMHTTISFTPDQLKNLVHGHNGNKSVESWSQYMQNIVQGTGALISTLDDQLIYLEANMGITSTPLYDAMKLSHELTFQHSGLYSDGIGLGWNLFTTEGKHIIWKNGANGGYNSFMGFDKETKTGVVILVNSSLNPEIFATDMGFEIVKALNRF
ncbi:MAG: serine hydrolase domain-containing protein [Chryseolinea sp.]